MSWHYSRALVEAYLEANCLDGEQSAPWKSIPSVPDDSCSAKMKDTFHRSPFGMMFVPSTDGLGVGLLKWFLEDSHAKKSALPEMEKGWKGPGLGYGLNNLESYAKYDQKSHLLRTPQCLLFEDFGECCVILPRSGMMLNGELYPLPMQGLLIYEKESGLLPTPTATDYKGGRSPEAAEKSGRGPANGLRDFCRLVLGWKRPKPEALESLMGWPIGWTGQEPLATDKFQQWYNSHVKS